MPEVAKIIAPYIVHVAPKKDDMKQNTDLIVSPARVSVRIREYEYLFQKDYLNEFTIRSKRPSGQTELSKVISGWGDYTFYGFANPGKTGLAAWMVGDLRVFRLWFANHLAMNDGQQPGEEFANEDSSSSFRAFKINQLPKGFLLARVTPDMNQISSTTVSDSASRETMTDDRLDEYTQWIGEDS